MHRLKEGQSRFALLAQLGSDADVVLLGHGESSCGWEDGSVRSRALRGEEVTNPLLVEQVAELPRISEAAWIADEGLRARRHHHHNRPAIGGTDEGQRAIGSLSRKADLSSRAILSRDSHGGSSYRWENGRA